MLVIYYLIAGALALAVLSYLCFELHYFARLLLAIVLAKYCKKRAHILDELIVRGEFKDYTFKLNFNAETAKLCVT